MSMPRLEKKLFFHYEIELLSGLRIGDSKEDVEIGGVDNPVIRRKDTYEPYIPGSSLKGKMRCLLEQRYGENPDSNSQNTGSLICCLFGAGENTFKIKKIKDELDVVDKKMAEGKITQTEAIEQRQNLEKQKNTHNSRISRLIVRDAYLTKEWFKKLRDSEHTDMPFTEIKWENTIDRLLGKAKDGGIRQMERVPAGAKFNAHFVINIFSNEPENEYEGLLSEGIELLMDDYLGGSGTRGYGQVRLKLIEKKPKEYKLPENPKKVEEPTP